jgi:cytochrome c-type biogenesis protein CcmF
MNLLPNIGVALVWTGLASILVAIVSYLIGLRTAGEEGESKPPAQRFARLAYFAAAACVIGIAVIHSTLLLTHRFDINYVYRYSARGLPPGYLFATFWAGQEGSFLLWAFWTSVLGAILACTAGRRIEPRVMPVYGCVLAFLLVILAVKSPFAPYAPMSPSDPIGTPADGMGLNPLLENPWMVVHPPTLFLGFSSLAVTFSFGIAALLWGDFDNWFRRTWPWALFSFAVLGFGVMLGGYWAYETLGWGGFWGWDPVENGPLVPWLGMTAYLHAAQTQRARGSLKRTTLFLGMFPFVAALYETFLTRTGILDKFSNHSFSTLGGVANSIILYGLLFAVAVSVSLLIWRSSKIKSETGSLEDASSRDFGMTLAIAILLLCAVITGVGMSAPLITQAGVSLGLIQNQSSVQQDFYNKANFPVALLMLLGMAVGPYLAWRQTIGKQIEPLMWSYVAAVLSTLGFFVVGHLFFHTNTTAPLIMMFALSMMCILANIRLLSVRRGLDAAGLAAGVRTAGGALAHIGAAVFLLGVVFLVAWYRQDDEILVAGHSRAITAFPMTVTFTGTTSTLRDPANDLKLDVLEGARGKQVHYVALMPLAVRDVEGTEKLLARPAIVHRWWGDLYFAMKDGPEQISPTALLKANILKGESATLAGYRVQFNGFEVPPADAADVKQGIMPAVFPVTAHMVVTPDGGAARNVDVQLIQYQNDPLAPTSPEVRLPMTAEKLPFAIAFTGMDADTGSAQFYVRDADEAPVPAYTIEVSTRPMIGLVWLGTVLIALGGLISMRRRMLENRLVPVPDPEPIGQLTSRQSRRETRSERHGRTVRSRTSPEPAKGGH